MTSKHKTGPVAQWLEQVTHNLLVAGSNPAGTTTYASREGHSQCACGGYHLGGAYEAGCVMLPR